MGLYQLWMKGPDFELRYNCSFYSVEDVPLEKRQHKIFAIVVFALGVIFEVMYLPCVYALSRRKLLASNFCYKLMLIMSIEDMITLVVTTIVPGYMSYYGYTYCSNPDLVYFFGAVIIAFWLAYSQTSLLLAVNRCMSLALPQYRYIFEGYKQYLFLLIPFTTCFYDLFFGVSASYSPVHNAWFFDPHRGYFDDLEGKYSSDLQYYNNLVFVTGLPIIYIIFVVHHFAMSRNREGGMPKKEVALFIQTLVVNFTIAMSALGYLVMQYLNLPPEAIAVTHISWVIVEGTPPIVYLTINQTIRKIVIDGKNEFSSWIGVKRGGNSIAANNSSHIVSNGPPGGRRVSNMTQDSRRISTITPAGTPRRG